MQSDREIMQQALSAFEAIMFEKDAESCQIIAKNARYSLREALAQPEQPQTDLRKAAEMALDALEKYEDEWLDDGRRIYVDAELEALRQALSQPEQAPVAWMYEIFGDTVLTTNQKKIDLVLANEKTVTPLYTAPPSKPWVGLTDDEIEKIVDLNTSDDGGFDIWCDGIAVAHIVCAKLKEKNA